MRNENNKELDKLFQKRLRNDQPADNNWNVPPIDVFEAAMSEIGEDESKKRRSFIPFLLSGVIIIGGLIYMLIQNQKMIKELYAKIEVMHEKMPAQPQAETIVDPIENNLNSADLSSNKSRNSTSESKNTSDKNTINFNAAVEQNNTTLPLSTTKLQLPKNTVENRSISNAPVSSTAATFNNKLSNATANNIVSNTRNNTIGTPTNSATINSSSTSSSPQTNLAKQTFVVDGENQNQILLLVDPIASLNLNLKHQNNNSLPIAFVDVPTDNKNQIDAGKLSVYAFGGLNFSSFRLDGWFEDNLNVTGHNNSEIGHQYGVEVNYKVLPKWSAGARIGQRQIINSSTCNGQVEYDEANEFINGNNELVFRTNNHVMTPLGDFTEQMEIPVEENEMSDGDIMESTTVNQQTLNANFASASIHYHALQFGKFDLIANGGAGLNFNLKRELESDMSIHLGDKEMMHKVTNNDNMGIAYDSFVTIFGGVNLQYHLMKNLNVRLGVNYETSPSSLRISPIIGQDFKLNSLNTNLSVGYNF